jgi:Na+/phosphate symporter
MVGQNLKLILYKIIMKEEFEDTKGVIRIRKSKKNRQRNREKKKHKRTKNDLQSTTQKTKDLIFTMVKYLQIIREFNYSNYLSFLQMLLCFTLFPQGTRRVAMWARAL